MKDMSPFRLFGIMSNKRPGGNVLIIMMLTSIVIPFPPEYYKEFVGKIIFSLRIIHKNNFTTSVQHRKIHFTVKVSTRNHTNNYVTLYNLLSVINQLPPSNKVMLSTRMKDIILNRDKLTTISAR